jgi:quinol-cytochrome oxidoreductase complex cytochrome b subunit
MQPFVRKHKVIVAVFIFLLLFSAFHYFKPSFAYNEEGGFRPFGVGYKHKTVVPIWVVAIVLAIFSYLLVLSLSR